MRFVGEFRRRDGEYTRVKEAVSEASCMCMLLP